MPKRSVLAIVILVLSMLGGEYSTGAAGFASPAFEQVWRDSEAQFPNFWGPMLPARDGLLEPYDGTPLGQRLVQYFDKGRMELGADNTTVTSGLLAVEMIGGTVQIANGQFERRPPPPTPVAGDLDNPGPTYAHLATKAAGILAPALNYRGGRVTAVISPAGDLSFDAAIMMKGPTALADYDTVTKHNVITAFAAYRGFTGVGAIGYAISEPFQTTIKVGGTQRTLIVQVFERRVLTFYTDATDHYVIEFGNIGQHYYRWRYGV